MTMQTIDRQTGPRCRCRRVLVESATSRHDEAWGELYVFICPGCGLLPINCPCKEVVW